MWEDTTSQRIVPKVCSEISVSELKSLKPEDIAIIETALIAVNPFGEVHLVVADGRLREIRTIQSEVIDNVIE